MTIRAEVPPRQQFQGFRVPNQPHRAYWRLMAFQGSVYPPRGLPQAREALGQPQGLHKAKPILAAEPYRCSSRSEIGRAP